MKPILRCIGGILAPCPVAPRRWPAGGRRAARRWRFTTPIAGSPLILGTQRRSGAGLGQAAGAVAGRGHILSLLAVGLGGNERRRVELSDPTLSPRGTVGSHLQAPGSTAAALLLFSSSLCGVPSGALVGGLQRLTFECRPLGFEACLSSSGRCRLLDGASGCEAAGSCSYSACLQSRTNQGAGGATGRPWGRDRAYLVTPLGSSPGAFGPPQRVDPCGPPLWVGGCTAGSPSPH